MDLTMLKKFETKTNRVKGLSFHPFRPWILVSLHSGVIQLYDYRMEILLDSFEEHDGPVRGVDFHKTQPLFVSGGDDYKVKVWNYQMRRCLYTLHGHLDYIRTVQFHPSDHPWILSASDDQTVRIWNWQSRTCLIVLTGHNHYVMCAQWHPSEDLILSASLDQTVRIWDISGLRKRSTSVVEDKSNSGDVFGNVDAVVKFVLEGHSRGVNWASFHPSMNLVVSGADDREIKVWRMSGSRAWETTTYRGHLNNVSCVVFHPKENVIVSNSEDKTLRVWDVSRTQSPLCFRRENDRYWILASHPRLNLLAAGHDSGMVIFKLSRERPPFDMCGEDVFYLKEGYIRQFSSMRDSPLIQTRGGSFGAKRGNKRPRKLICNPYASRTVHNFLLFFDGEDSEYELYCMSRKGEIDNRGARSAACAVAFVTRNRFAVLDNTGELVLKNLENVSKKKIRVPERSVNYIFSGGSGRLLLRSPEWITLFDVPSRKLIREIQIQSRFPIKFAHWSPDFQRVALLARFSVMICDQDLNDICTIYENAKVKSGAWDGGVFVYTTVTHMKYALPSGDHGIIKTLDEVLYVAQVKDNTVTCVTRDTELKNLEIDNTEYVFKKALIEERYGFVQRLIESGKLRGESIIAYLQKRGFPEVALRFVDDPQTRFELALECGNIDAAFDCARQINTDKCWDRFGRAALMQGNYRCVTEAYKQTLNFEKLMYLFALTGNFPMLEKLGSIATQKDDKLMRFNVALLTGNTEERIKALMDCRQMGLAYLTAKSHGFPAIAEQIKEQIGDQEIIYPRSFGDSSPPQPPKPVFGPFTEHEKYDWPRSKMPDSQFMFDVARSEATEERERQEKGRREERKSDALDSSEEVEDKAMFDWDGDSRPKAPSRGGDSAQPSWPEGEIELSDVSDEETEEKGMEESYFVMPKDGQSINQKWFERSLTPADMVAAGAFDLAQENLHRQFAIVNFAPLKSHFLNIYASAKAELMAFPNTSDISVALSREASGNGILPAVSLRLEHCEVIKREAFVCVTKADFAESIKLFRCILQIIPLLVVTNNEELKDCRQLIAVCREYINALRVKLAANAEKDAIRKFELNCYFTHYDLQDAHLFSGLYGAIKFGYNSKNFETTAVLCRRLLELSVSGRVRSEASQKHVLQVQKVLKKCESKGGDASSLAYKPHDFGMLCAHEMVPLSRADVVKCPYCGAAFNRGLDGKLCLTCDLSRVGSSAQGVTIQIS